MDRKSYFTHIRGPAPGHERMKTLGVTPSRTISAYSDSMRFKTAPRKFSTHSSSHNAKRTLVRVRGGFITVEAAELTSRYCITIPRHPHRRAGEPNLCWHSGE